MSAGTSIAPAPVYRPGPNGGRLRVWQKGESGNPSGITPERRALLDAIERNQVPKVLRMLDALFDRGIEGDDIAAKEWLLQVRGPVKPRTEEQIESAVEEKLLEIISEARRRREPPP